jgi:ubiquitin fusion degradation protein 1
MLFRLSSDVENKTTHCGVLEFTADEGTCYIPFWMMQNLLIEEGELITVTNVSLPKATFVKLQPQSVDFLEITNPRAVLEHALRNFSCVTKGDIIQLPYNNKNYHFALKEVEPQDAACIIETDCNVDFDAPVGYKEPDYKKQTSTASSGATSSAGSSRVPSPSTTMSTGSSDQQQQDDNDDSNKNKPLGTRIVNGKIIRPDESEMQRQQQPAPSLMAERTGRTGVQKNAAIPEAAPQVDYWAVNAGDGARLDGKSPSILRDKDGNEVDVRKLRAEAAAKRAEAAAAAQSASLSSSVGKTLKGEDVPPATAPPGVGGGQTAAPVSKRKTKVGSKFSRLKSGNVAFKGSANNLK